jgi:SAM-dependent methyltransferase
MLAFWRNHSRNSSPARTDKFEQRPPDHRNAIELFEGRWATDLSTLNPVWPGGTSALLTDSRPLKAARYLGSGRQRLDGMSVLELGPLEGAHTWQLEQLGAERIVAIEANTEAYLKCLIMKEVLGLKRATFMLGDFSPYLAETDDRFDLIFCSGVLYHMEYPLRLIRDIARVAERCFVWTHYYANTHPTCSHRVSKPVALDGYSAPHFAAPYQDRMLPRFWGGNKSSSSWMARGDIIAAFRHFGFERVETLDDEPDHINGPSFSLAVSNRPPL